MPSCRSISIRQFNRFGVVKVVDENNNKTPDSSDTYVLSDRSGKKLKFNNWRVQAIYKSVVQHCREKANRASRRAALATELGVRFGKAKSSNRCACESIGVYSRSGRYLFDIHSKSFKFCEREIAIEVSRGLKKPIPRRFRTKLTIGKGVKAMLRKNGYRLNRGLEQIEFPDSRELKFSGDARDSFNISVHMKVKSDEDKEIKITYRQGNGIKGKGILELKTGILR